jgi:hypothetical protein
VRASHDSRRPTGPEDEAMTLRPKTPTDLTLAPVAAAIDLNLQELRDEPSERLVDVVAFTLNTAPAARREERAKQILEVATRGVELHGWTVAVSADATRVQLRGGSVSLDVGLSMVVRDYIEGV